MILTIEVSHNHDINHSSKHEINHHIEIESDKSKECENSTITAGTFLRRKKNQCCQLKVTHFGSTYSDPNLNSTFQNCQYSSFCHFWDAKNLDLLVDFKLPKVSNSLFLIFLRSQYFTQCTLQSLIGVHVCLFIFTEKSLLVWCY